MPDSPLCPNCRLKELNCNTYKIAGKPMFKCATCKNVFHHGGFKKEDFEWRGSGKIKLYTKDKKEKDK